MRIEYTITFVNGGVAVSQQIGEDSHNGLLGSRPVKGTGTGKRLADHYPSGQAANAKAGILATRADTGAGDSDKASTGGGDSDKANTGGGDSDKGDTGGGIPPSGLTIVFGPIVICGPSAPGGNGNVK